MAIIEREIRASIDRSTESFPQDLELLRGSRRSASNTSPENEELNLLGLMGSSLYQRSRDLQFLCNQAFYTSSEVSSELLEARQYVFSGVKKLFIDAIDLLSEAKKEIYNRTLDNNERKKELDSIMNQLGMFMVSVNVDKANNDFVILGMKDPLDPQAEWSLSIMTYEQLELSNSHKRFLRRTGDIGIEFFDLPNAGLMQMSLDYMEGMIPADLKSQWEIAIEETQLREQAIVEGIEILNGTPEVGIEGEPELIEGSAETLKAAVENPSLSTAEEREIKDEISSTEPSAPLRERAPKPPVNRPEKINDGEIEQIIADLLKGADPDKVNEAEVRNLVRLLAADEGSLSFGGTIYKSSAKTSFSLFRKYSIKDADKSMPAKSIVNKNAVKFILNGARFTLLQLDKSILPQGIANREFPLFLEGLHKITGLPISKIESLFLTIYDHRFNKKTSVEENELITPAFSPEPKIGSTGTVAKHVGIKLSNKDIRFVDTAVKYKKTKEFKLADDLTSKLLHGKLDRNDLITKVIPAVRRAFLIYASLAENYAHSLLQQILKAPSSDPNIEQIITVDNEFVLAVYSYIKLILQDKIEISEPSREGTTIAGQTMSLWIRRFEIDIITAHKADIIKEASNQLDNDQKREDFEWLINNKPEVFANLYANQIIEVNREGRVITFSKKELNSILLIALVSDQIILQSILEDIWMTVGHTNNLILQQERIDILKQFSRDELLQVLESSSNKRGGSAQIGKIILDTLQAIGASKSSQNDTSPNS